MRNVFALLLLAACASPSPPFAGAPRTEVEVDGSAFAVFRRGLSVEVYRTSREWRPSEAAIKAKSMLAIEEATGCAVASGSLDGDQALITARLSCDPG